MLSHLIGNDRIKELAGKRAELAAQGCELADLTGAPDVAALKAGTARLATQMEFTIGEGEALRRMMEVLGDRVARLGCRWTKQPRVPRPSRSSARRNVWSIVSSR